MNSIDIKEIKERDELASVYRAGKNRIKEIRDHLELIEQYLENSLESSTNGDTFTAKLYMKSVVDVLNQTHFTLHLKDVSLEPNTNNK